MRFMMALLTTLLAAAPALAVEHTLVRWKKTGQCEIVTHLPIWGDHWVVVNTYNSRAEAERALSNNRRTKICPTYKSANRAEKLPQHARPSLTYRSGGTINRQ